MSNSQFLRFTLAVICGILTNYLLYCALSAGIYYRFGREEGWSFLFWGEHWFVRSLAACICTAWAGFTAGLVSRTKGAIAGLVSSVPGWLLWLFATYSAVTGTMPIISGIYDIHISVGNQLFGGIILLATFPIALYSGALGADMGVKYAEHFDSRPHTLLGIKWYHYLWIPIIMHLIFMQVGFAGIYGLEWFRHLYKVGPYDIVQNIVRGVPTFIVFWSLYIMYLGLEKSYMLIAGFHSADSGGKTLLAILKYAVGYQIVAVAIEIGVELVHYYLSR